MASPLVNTTCPIAVKHNITHIAMRADKGKLYAFVINLITKTEIQKTPIKTINGFIGGYYLFKRNLLKKVRLRHCA